MRSHVHPDLPATRQATLVALLLAAFVAVPSIAGAARHEVVRHVHRDVHVGPQIETAGDEDGFDFEIVNPPSKRGREHLVWARLDGREWVLRSRDDYARAEAIVEPLTHSPLLGEIGGLAGRMASVAVDRAMRRLRDAERDGWQERRETDREIAQLERRIEQVKREIHRLATDVKRQMRSLVEEAIQRGRAERYEGPWYGDEDDSEVESED